MDVNDTLSTREGQYGQYKVVSQISQDIKKVMRQSPTTTSCLTMLVRVLT